MKLKFLFIFSLSVFSPVLSQPLDYSSQNQWMVLPDKVPSFYLNKSLDSTFISKVDVFYVFPTTLVDYSDPRWNAEMSDKKWAEDAFQTTIRFQASAWQECGRMFAPYYRQAHLKAYDSLSGKGRDALLFAYEDVKAAFEYYLKHYNQGRPFILAGHSQGCTQLTLLIKEFIDGKPLAKQLIAAYLPGVGLEVNEFSHIPFMVNPTQFGGFVTWNTMNDQPDNDLYPLWYKGKACINPVTWDLTAKTERKQHQGFYFTNEKLYSNVFETELISGAICVRNFRPPFQLAVKRYENLHVGDINLFWKDIGYNCKERIKAYLNSF